MIEVFIGECHQNRWRTRVCVGCFALVDQTIPVIDQPNSYLIESTSLNVVGIEKAAEAQPKADLDRGQRASKRSHNRSNGIVT